MGLGAMTGGDGETALSLYIAGNNTGKKSSWYFDGFISGPDDSTKGHYSDHLDENTFGDEITDRKTYYTGLHFGPTYDISPKVTFYAGAGVMWAEEVIYLYDPTHILDSDGEYSVEGEKDSKLSVSTGLMFNLNKFSAKAGYVSAAKAWNVAIGMNF